MSDNSDEDADKALNEQIRQARESIDAKQEPPRANENSIEATKIELENLLFEKADRAREKAEREKAEREEKAEAEAERRKKRG